MVRSDRSLSVGLTAKTLEVLRTWLNVLIDQFTFSDTLVAFIRTEIVSEDVFIDNLFGNAI